MAYLYLAFVLAAIMTVIKADYPCVCNYGRLASVYLEPVENSYERLGWLAEFKCQPTYGNRDYKFNYDPYLFIAIQYRKHVGYVLLDDGTEVQKCRGSPSLTDIVPTHQSRTQRTPTLFSLITRRTTESNAIDNSPTSASYSSHNTSRRRSASFARTPSSSSVSHRSTTSTRSPTSSSTESQVGWHWVVGPMWVHCRQIDAPIPAIYQGGLNVSVVSRTTPPRSSPSTSTAALAKSKTVSGTTTPRTAAERPQTDIMNEPRLSTGFSKGTVAGIVLSAFLIGLIGGAVAVLGFVKFRMKTARKYEVFFNKDTVNTKAV